VSTAPATAQYGVASGHPLGVEAGLAALAAGGSAVDGVLSAAFAQWVVSGPLCGPGGELVVLLVHDAADPDSEITVFGGWSRTPLGFPVDGPVRSDGPTGAVVPGGVAGAAAASSAAGSLKWTDLFASARHYAEGHVVTPWMHRSYQGVVDKGHGEALRGFLDQPEVPRPGDEVSCSRLGKTLSRLAECGAEDFYRGELADTLLAASRDAGGYLSAADLDAVTAEVCPAPRHTVGDLTVAVTSPPSQAGIVPELLAAADPDADPTGAPYAEQVAPVVERELVSRCIAGVPGTAATVAHDGVAMAAVVHSLAGVQFGTGWVAGDTGIALSNRVGTSLSTRSDLPAANPKPGAMLAHTLSAAVFRRGTRAAIVATPGGDRQVQWLAQAGQRFRRGAGIDEMATGPRWFVCPVGDRFGVPAGIGKEWFLFAEPGIAWEREMSVAGYAVRRVDSGGGGMQTIERTPAGWALATDPRMAGATGDEGATDVRRP
jgi:gamma-glutamyltranspeptidase